MHLLVLQMHPFFAGYLASEALSNEHGEAEDFILENCQIISKHWYSNVLPLIYILLSGVALFYLLTK